MKVPYLIFLSMFAAVVNVAVAGDLTVSPAVVEDWVFQADGKPSIELAIKEMYWARQIAARIGDRVNLDAELKELDKLSRHLEDSTKKPGSAKDFYFAVRQLKRSIMFKNPLIDFNEILLIDNPYPGTGGIPARYTRVSIGLEESEDLIADFKQAIQRCG